MVRVVGELPYHNVLYPQLCLLWLDVQFSTEKRSILAAGDISQFIPDQEADVAVLEEPEHLTWYYHGRRWTDKFQHVVGVVHTNYLEYVKREKNGRLQAFLLRHVNNWVVRIYCNKVSFIYILIFFKFQFHLCIYVMISYILFYYFISNLISERPDCKS